MLKHMLQWLIAGSRGGPNRARLIKSIREEPMNANQLCERLLEETGVAILPGMHFGSPPTELTARLSYVNFDGRLALGEALKRGREGEVDEEFLKNCCQQTIEGARRLANWLRD
jgi:aspartate aminotransferase